MGVIWLSLGEVVDVENLHAQTALRFERLLWSARPRLVADEV